MMHYDAIYFDLDGTLLDSVADLADAINRMLAHNGYPTVPLEKFPLYIGDGVTELVRRVLPIEALERGELQARVDEYQSFYEITWNLQSRPYSGLIEILNALSKRGDRIGVLSNKPQHFTELCVHFFFKNIPFVSIRGARPDCAKKPSPEAILEELQHLQARPQHSVYIGDSGVDMQMAQAAGMISIGVLWGFRDRDELEKAGAQYIAPSTSALAKLLSLESCP